MHATAVISFEGQRTGKTIDFFAEEKATDNWSNNIPSNKVAEQLYACFTFDLTGIDKHQVSLNPEQLSYVTSKLPKLILVSCDYYHSKRKEIEVECNCYASRSVFTYQLKRRLITYPLQNPIKNLICYPE
ncbi:hypothetical protein [Mucilaginibacter sp. PAMB04168]|uniref:hypothetical protein n=1 Tax=Mucilaginibacter sp. PAMB04168 TaxID=3138567 RepID=UPI0031F6D59D